MLHKADGSGPRLRPQMHRSASASRQGSSRASSMGAPPRGWLAYKVSSVSPLRWLTITPHPLLDATHDDLNASLTVPI